MACPRSLMLALLIIGLAAWPAAAMVSPAGRQLLQEQAPTNCSAADDSWTRTRFSCSIPPEFTAECALASPPAPPDTANCQVANDERPNIRTGLTCPVQDCRVVCDMIVMQNFFPPDLVVSVAELLAAWKPAAPGC